MLFNKFIDKKKIGKGVFGNVYKVNNFFDKQSYALKIYRDYGEHCRNEVKSIIYNEVSTLKALQNSDFIIKIYDLYYDEDLIGLSMELAEMNLYKYIDIHRNNIDNNMINKLYFELLSGIDHCHNNNFLHLDLKPQNILIDKNKTIKNM